MILPSNWEVLVPGLSLVRTLIIQRTLAGNFMIKPGAGNILQERFLLLQPLIPLLGFVVDLQQRVELTQVEVEVLDEVIKIWSLVLYGFPNNLEEDSVCSTKAVYF